MLPETMKPRKKNLEEAEADITEERKMIQKNNVLGYFQDAYLRARGQRVLFVAFCGKKR